MEGDWKAAKDIFDKNKELIRYGINGNNETTLHVAVSRRKTMFVENLMTLMEEKDLELQDNNSYTALCIAVTAGDVQMATILVRKNKALRDIPTIQGMMPIQMAASFGKQDMTKLLYDSQNMRDVALQLLKVHPELVLNRGSMLRVLAQKPHAFEPKPPSGINSVLEYVPLVHRPLNWEGCPAWKLLSIILVSIAKLPRTEIYDIMRGPAEPVVKDENPNTPTREKGKYPWRVLFLAAEAVSCRHEDIFSLLYEVGSTKDCILTLEDKNGNKLHLAGILTERARRNCSVYSTGAAQKLQILENSFEVLKILKNSLEVLKVLENNLESMKHQENSSRDHRFGCNFYNFVIYDKPRLRGRERVENEPRVRTSRVYSRGCIPPNNEPNEPTQGDIGETSNEPTQAIRNEFEELYESDNEELYPGCDYVTRLDFMKKFTYFKVKGYKRPSSYYAIKKTFKTIWLGYESIYACINDCFLFRGEDHKDEQFYLVCNTSTWKHSNTSGKKVSKKVLHYFLIIPRLQHLYMSGHTAKQMTWHATRKCTKPSKMQHPVDGRAWKNFDTNMWQMILTTCNMPSWLCMKESSFMLTLLIHGPKSLGKDIDVYLRPLIGDLKDLWEKPDVETIDVATGQKFNMRAMVLGTINDFPARSSLSGWSGKCYKAFFTCNEDTPSTYVMRIEKNVLESILNTLLMNDKSKDTTKARQDLKRLGIRSGLWLGQKKQEKYLPANVAKPIIKLCLFFKKIFFQTLMEDDMLKAQSKVVDIMCNLELIYPPGFFDIMIYLVMYLPLEALEGGPILPRWISVCKSIGLRSVIRIDHQELKKVIWYVLHNNPKIDIPGQVQEIRQRRVDKDPGVSASSELFALACGLTPTLISVNSCVVNGVRFIMHNRDECRTTQNSGICSPGEDGEMYYVKDNPDIIHVDNSSDLTLSTSLNDLEITVLHIDGQSIDVDAPPDIIDVDEDVILSMMKMIKELELRTKQRNNFEKELFKDMPRTKEELAYHKELQDLGNIIDSSLSEVVLGYPFAQASKLTYDKSLGLIRFAHGNDEVMFRMPQRTKELDLVSPLKKDKFEAFFVESLKVIFDEKKLGMAGDCVASINRRRHAQSSDGVKILAMASVCGRLKKDLESLTVERGYGGDGGGNDRPPLHEIADGCQGKGTRKPNLVGGKADRMHTRKETKKLKLRKIMDKLGPEIVREFSMHFGSWRSIPLKQKAGVPEKIVTQFDLKPHMQSKLWPEIRKGIDQHLSKIYTDNKLSLKKDYWVKNPDDETYVMEAIKSRRPGNGY
nr:hypothetical protein [Tanacetum cinerariifolium]